MFNFSHLNLKKFFGKIDSSEKQEGPIKLPPYEIHIKNATKEIAKSFNLEKPYIPSDMKIVSLPQGRGGEITYMIATVKKYFLEKLNIDISQRIFLMDRIFICKDLGVLGTIFNQGMFLDASIFEEYDEDNIKKIILHELLHSVGYYKVKGEIKDDRLYKEEYSGVGKKYDFGIINEGLNDLFTMMLFKHMYGKTSPIQSPYAHAIKFIDILCSEYIKKNNQYTYEQFMQKLMTLYFTNNNKELRKITIETIGKKGLQDLASLRNMNTFNGVNQFLSTNNINGEIDITNNNISISYDMQNIIL